MARSVRVNFIFGLLIILIACNPKNRKEVGEDVFEELQLIDSVIFHVPFNYRYSHVASYRDPTSGKELRYFADITTKKEVVFYDLNGKLEYSVNLKEGVKALNRSVQDIEVIALDTILLIAPYTNKMVVVNREGKIWRKIDLNKVLGLDKDSTKSYEFISSLSSTTALINKSDIILYVTTKLKKQLNNTVEFAIASMVTQWENKQFIKINDLLTDSINYVMGGNLIQTVNPDEPTAFMISIFNYYTITNQAIFTTNSYSDKVYSINPTTLEVTNSYSIESKHTPLGVPLLPFKDKYDYDKVLNAGKEGFKKRGKLQNITFNPNREHFYITARIDDNNKEYDGHFSFMIYNKYFNKKGEFLINTEKYLGPIFITDKGFMLKKRVEFENGSNQEVVMHEFTY